MGDFDEVERLRAGIRGWLSRAARNGRNELQGAPGSAVLSMLCAAAFGPVLAASAGLTNAVAVAGLEVLSSVGGGVLGDVLASAVERARSSGAGRQPSQDELERELALRIEKVLTAQDRRAEDMRCQIAAILQEIDAGRVLLQAAVETGNEELQREVLAAIAMLNADFGDMGFLLTGLARAADEIQDSLGGQGAQLRAISDQVGRQSADVRMIREEVAVIEQRTRRRMLGPPGAAGPALRWPDGCPYRGLLPYDEGHEAVFYGRERLTAELIGMLAEAGLVLVTGASGAGKSSLLQAGIVPALARGVQVPGSSSWPRVSITPTTRPLTELATHLALVGRRDSTVIRRALTDAPGNAHLIAREVVLSATDRQNTPAMRSSAQRLVLIVDQFEQIFSLTGDDADHERAAFIEAVCSMATRPAGPQGEPPAMVLIAIRGDYWDRCADYPQLVSAMQQGQFVVGPMTEAELRRVITGPAEASGLRIEDALVQTVLGDLRIAGSGQSAGVLPLLSEAMALTWEEREGDRLTSRGYGISGGISRAVEVSAEAAYARLPETQKVIARDILRRMTSIGADRRSTRRRVSRDDLYAGHAEDEWAQVDAVLEAFARRRLLVLNARSAEIAHDALLQAWPRLRGWLEEDQAGFILYGQLSEDAALWHQNRKDPSFLYRGAQFAATRQAAEVWVAGHGKYPALTAIETEFLDASDRAVSRANRRRRVLAATLVVLLIAALAGTGIAINAARTADQQRSAAISGRLTAQSTALDAVDPVTASLLAVAAWRVSPTPQARYSVLESLAQPVRGVLTSNSFLLSTLTFSPDGRTLAAGYGDGVIRLWDLASHQPIRTTVWQSSADTRPKALAFGDNGKTLEAAMPGAILKWNFGGHAKAVISPFKALAHSIAAFSPDGTTLATDDGAVLQFWDVATQREIGIPVEANAGQMTFSPNGKILATSDGGVARLWDVATQRQVGTTITASTGEVFAMAFSHDGGLLATGGDDGNTRLWDVATQRRSGQVMKSGGVVLALAFNSNGTTLAVAGSGDMTRLWSVATHHQTGAPLTEKTTRGLQALAFSPAGNLLATGDTEGTIKLWDPAEFHQAAAPLTIRTSEESPTTAGHNTAVFSADGRILVGADDNGAAWLWDVVSRRTIGVYDPKGSYGISGLAISPDGKTLAVVANSMQLWRIETGRPLGKPVAANNAIGVAFGPDGKLLAIGGEDSKAQLWQAASQRPVGKPMTVSRPGATNWVMAFSPDGSMLATSTYGGATQLWDVRTQHKVGTLASAGTTGVSALAFSPNSTMLAIASGTGTTRLWKIATQQQIGAPMTADTFTINAVAFSPDGTSLATASSDGTTRLWDIATQQEIGAAMTADTHPVDAVAFAQGGKLATANGDKTARLWNVAFARNLLSAACSISGQSLSRKQWANYVGPEPFQQICAS